MAFYENDYPNGTPFISEKGRFTVDIVENYSFNAHWHNEIELLLMVDGEMRICVEDREQICVPGDIIICERGQLHYASCVSEHTTQVILVFDPTYIRNPNHQRKFAVNFVDRAFIEQQNIPESVVQEMRSCFMRLCEEEGKRRPLYGKVSECYLNILVEYLFRYTANAPSNARGRNKSASFIKDVCEYIDSNFMQDLSIDLVSQDLGVSPIYLTQVCQKSLGKGFKTYLKEIRVMKSKILLCNTDELIISIAMNCGFESIRTFNRVFKEFEGTTPSEYRRQMQRII